MEKVEKDLSIQEVTSTNQQFFQALKKDAQEMVAREKEKRQRLILPLNYAEFVSLFSEFGKVCLFNRKQSKDFILDKYNEPVIKQLYFYLMNDPSFVGNLDRGILLQGKYGCGKTVLLETYSLLHNHIVSKFSINHPLLLFIKSVELQNQIILQSTNTFVRRPLIIDEFGRESKTVQNFGNVSRPISELLSLRSDVGAITHGTTNFTLTTLSSDDFYGGMIGDRLKVMFNFITLKGESRRV